MNEVSKYVRLFLNSAIEIVHTVPWLRYPNKNVFRERQNSLYNKCASFSYVGRLFHSPGPAAANALSPKVLYVLVTTYVRLTVECSSASTQGVQRIKRKTKKGAAILRQPTQSIDNKLNLICMFECAEGRSIANYRRHWTCGMLCVIVYARVYIYCGY